MAIAVQLPRKKISVPNQGPFTTAILICPTCAQVVLPTLSRLASGEITDIIFYHTNEQYGCAWKNVDSKARALGPTTGLKDQVRSGNDSKGHAVFIDERDLAAGKSFDLDGLKPHIPAGHDIDPGFYLPRQTGTATDEVLAGLNAKLASSTLHPETKPTPKFEFKPNAVEPAESKSETEGDDDAA